MSKNKGQKKFFFGPITIFLGRGQIFLTGPTLETYFFANHRQLFDNDATFLAVKKIFT
jgi:hypothetical protein